MALMDPLSSTGMELLKIARLPKEKAMSAMVEKKQKETKPDQNKKVGKIKLWFGAALVLCPVPGYPFH